MSGRIYPLDEPNRPAPSHNNLWYEDRKSDQVIVFVHGVLSDSHGCWYRGPTDSRPGVYWPDLLRKDRRFNDFSIFLGGYYTSITSGPYEVSDCATELFNALSLHDEQDGARSVFDHRTIVFVCHSMGGIVIRYLLTSRPWLFKEKRIGLALIASPSTGSPWADRLDLLLKYFKHEQGKELKWGNWRLEDLDGRFRTLLHDKFIPELYGAEACEQRFVFDKKWFPPLTPVVPRGSAGVYFDRVEMFPNTDHFTCVKPTDKDDASNRFLVKLCAAISRGDSAIKPTMPAPAPTPLPTPGAPAQPHSCQSLHWDVKIDEEGDAYNEMSYKSIVLPSKRPYVFELPPAEVQSGHTTEFELIWDGRTTEGASLRRGNVVSPTKIEMNVGFLNRPTAVNPASFAVRCWDWNVYSMNMEEYRQKPNWREDGLDYAEKFIPQPWQRFAMIIQFPPQLVFAKLPFFEIYDASDDPDQARNDELTVAYQRCFFFSSVFRQAVLVVEQPPAPYSYRISWLLGESRVSVASALIPLQRQRQRAFAQQLLHMRRARESHDAAIRDAAQPLEDGVNAVLAAVAENVQKILGDAPLDPASLEISLMVLDEEHPLKPPMGNRELPCLRIVAGTLLKDPGYSALAVFVGDGNAGRAWKRRMARVFDLDEKDPKRHVYVPVSDSRRHRFLVSIPLIDPDSDALVFGILNFGTFSAEQAELLRKIGAADEVQNITSYAQSYVLKRLMELLRI